jgi:hypothetical protein
MTELSTTRPDVSLLNWQDAPYNRWAFQHVSELVPTAVLSRGSAPARPLARDEWPIESVVFDGTAGPTAIEAFLDRTCTDGLLVLDGGVIRAEYYLNGMTAHTHHLLMSVSKSLCGMLFGHYVARGQVDTQAHVTAYVPELADTAYGDATIQQVLDMTVGVEFNEDYHDPDSHVQTQDRVAGLRPPHVGDPEDSYAFLQTLRRSGRHGVEFRYCSANTDVLGWVLERVSGRRYADVLSGELWSKIGVEHDAFITVDRSGFPLANGGMCATLRDLGRFGLMVLDDGRVSGRQVVPADWVRESRTGGDPGVAAPYLRAIHPNGRYHNQWWLSGDAHGTFYGTGIYGQYLWIDPVARVVIAKASSLPVATDPTMSREHAAAFRAIVAAVMSRRESQ